ncbi:MAG: type II toxin-antitoxin system HipA family toxin [Bacteroidota bacterium]
MRVFSVHLNDIKVGQVVEEGEAAVAFRTLESYRRRAQRPVLSLSFEEDLRRVYAGENGRLPSFFANLVPEKGPVRDLLVQSTGVPASDGLGLLGALGDDLPGAVFVKLESDDGASSSTPSAEDREAARAPRRLAEGIRLRFSIAGVQLKLSMIRDADGIVLPATGKAGQVIVKFDSPQVPGLVENEYATMEWARAAGFNVPSCELLSSDVLDEPFRELGPPGSPVYVIERFDRRDGTRVHQEDLAQVIGLYPECKYGAEESGCPKVDWTGMLRGLRGIGAKETYEEALRRLVLMVAIGNDDAHLKNWALLYPDDIRPRLAPLYDQVAIAAWKDGTMRWALPWNGDRSQAKRTTLTTFANLAERVGESRDDAQDIARDTLNSLAEAWSVAAELFPRGCCNSLSGRRSLGA